jgi:hypothetical protein
MGDSCSLRSFSDRRVATHPLPEGCRLYTSCTNPADPALAPILAAPEFSNPPGLGDLRIEGNTDLKTVNQGLRYQQ